MLLTPRQLLIVLICRTQVISLLLHVSLAFYEQAGSRNFLLKALSL